MKLLLVHRYIRPDTACYGHILYLMGRHLAAEGHDVTIFSTQPSYNDAYDGPPLPRKQIVDGMTIIRTPMLKENKKNKLRRAFNFLLFAFSTFWHATFRWKAYDVMTVSTFPPTMMGLAARWICKFRKTKYIYHCMDLYPEVAMTSNLLKPGFLARTAARVDSGTAKKQPP